MDRFIAYIFILSRTESKNLKSNMDRFIDTFNVESLKKIKI